MAKEKNLVYLLLHIAPLAYHSSEDEHLAAAAVLTYGTMSSVAPLYQYIRYKGNLTGN
jgi:hypothetical protein